PTRSGGSRGWGLGVGSWGRRWRRSLSRQRRAAGAAEARPRQHRRGALRTARLQAGATGDAKAVDVTVVVRAGGTAHGRLLQGGKGGPGRPGPPAADTWQYTPWLSARRQASVGTSRYVPCGSELLPGAIARHVAMVHSRQPR